MNYEFERHISSTEAEGNKVGAGVLSLLQTGFNLLVKTGMVKELPLKEDTPHDEIKRPLVDALLTLPNLHFDITKDTLNDPAFVEPILGAVLLKPYPTPELSSLATRTYNAILRSIWDYVRDESGVSLRYRKSMAELLQMSDEELLKKRNFGLKSLRLFEEAVQPLRERFIGS